MKNRKKANIILTILILIFLLLAVLKHYYGEPFTIRMLIFIVEAALVGSIADWFAVTALFKRPLGLPIKPVIPSNREKILSSLSTVVNNNLLNINYIQSTIESIPISKSLIYLADNTDAVYKAKNLLVKYTLDNISNLKNDNVKITKFVDRLKGKINDIDSTKTKAVHAADKYIQKHFTKNTYSNVIDKIIKYLNKDTTYNYIHSTLDKQMSGNSGKKFKLFDWQKVIVGDSEKLAQAVQAECISFLEELKASDEKYSEIKSIISRFSEDHLRKTDLSKLFNNFIDNFRIEEHIYSALTRLEKLLTCVSYDINSISSNTVQDDADLQAIANIITDLLQDLWKEIKNDKETLTWIDTLIKELMIEIVAKNRTEFSKFIEERIKGFTDEQLSNLVQNSAGEPLHWIRINGAMLGGMLGLVLFLFVNFLYEPHVLPIAYKLMSLF